MGIFRRFFGHQTDGNQKHAYIIAARLRKHYEETIRRKNKEIERLHSEIKRLHNETTKIRNQHK